MATTRKASEDSVWRMKAIGRWGEGVPVSPMEKLTKAFAKRGPHGLEDLADDLCLELERFERRVQSVWEEHHAPRRAWGDLVRDPKNRPQRLMGFIEELDTVVSDLRRNRAA